RPFATSQTITANPVQHTAAAISALRRSTPNPRSGRRTTVSEGKGAAPAMRSPLSYDDTMTAQPASPRSRSAPVAPCARREHSRPMNREAVRGGSLLASGRRFGVTPGILARLFAGGFHKILDRIDVGLESGSIRARLPDGSIRRLGGRKPGFEAEVHIRDWRCLVRLATGGSAGWYQAWEAGEWSSPDPVTLFAVFSANSASLGE